MSAKYKSPSFLLPNELNTSANPANDTGINSLYSMDFSGTDYISAPNTFLNSASVCTLSFWMKGTGEVGGGAPWNGLQIKVDVSNTSFRTMNGSNVNNYISFSPGTDWHHYVGVYVGGSFSKIYIDGVLKQTLSAGIPATLASTSGDIFKIGYGQTYSVAKIDEVAIWTRALSDGDVADGAIATGEIAALYDGTGSNIRPSNLMAANLNPTAYYPLGEQAQMQGYLGNEASSEWQFPNGVLQDYVMDFDGGDNINITDAPSPNGTQTLSMWINTSTSGNNGGLFTIAPNGATSDYWSVALWNSNIHCSTANTGSKQSTTNVADGNWHNIILVKSSSVCTHMYIDGDLQTLSNGSWQGPINTPQAKIGSGNYSNTEYYFTGKISNVVLWTSDQSTNISNIYNNGSPQTTYTVTPQNWWKLNADSVYTPSAPNYTTALEFDGTSDYIQGGNIGISGNATFSISYWAYWDGSSFSGDYPSVVGNSTFSVSNGLSTTWKNGRPALDFWSVRYRADNTLLTQQWYHLVFTKTQGAISTTSKIYVNGVEVNGSLEGTDTNPNITNSNLNIGRLNNVSTRYWNGFISNAAIFNSALTSAQVSTLFNFGTPETNISFSPQAWWKLDNTTTGIQDSSGNGNNGTNNGATDATTSVAVVPSWKIPSALTIPTINYTTALDFDGNTDYVTAGTTSYLNNVTEMSLSIWFNLNTAVQNKGLIGDFYGGATGHFGMSTTQISGNNYSLRINLNGDANRFNLTGSPFAAGQWHNLVMVFNAGALNFYIDGQPAAFTTYSGSIPSSLVNDTRNLTIGRRHTLYWDGLISNAQIWTTELSSSDALSIYNNGQPSTTAFGSPVSWWKLDSTTITDSAGSNNGTNNGATQVTSNVYAENIPVNGVSTTLPSTALQQSDLQFDSPYSNYSLSFDGTGDNINVGNIQSLQGSSNFSISAWINLSASFSNRIFGSWDTSVSKRIVGFAVSSVNTLVLQVSNDGTSFEQRYSTSTISTNVWTHVVVTFSSGNVNFYINGSVETPSNTTITQLYNVSSDYFIGALRSSETTPMNGNIDETSIFNTELTSAQVLEIYNNGRPKDLTTFSGTAPTNWWRLGENAYFDNNSFIVPNSITGAPNGTGAGTITTMISADAPGTYANGIGENLDILDRVGDAPLSTSNSQSYNMIPDDKSPYVPSYVGNQIANNFSMTFDGAINTSFNAGQSLNIYGSQPRTISCWFNINSFATTPNGDGSHLLGYGTATTLQAFSLAVAKYPNNPTHRIFLHVYNSASDISGTTQILENNWYLATVTYDGSTLKLYLNGNLEGSSSTSSLNTATSDFIIGQGVFSTWNTLNGKLDEVAIFDTALNAGQIYNDIYQPTATAPGNNQTADLVNNPNLPTPVAWYRMGD